MSLAEELEKMATKYGPERFTKTDRGFKLAFVGEPAIRLEVEVQLDCRMYLEEEPPTFKVVNQGSHETIKEGDCRELRSLLEDCTEEWMPEEVPILDRLMEIAQDWFQWKTEETVIVPQTEPVSQPALSKTFVSSKTAKSSPPKPKTTKKRTPSIPKQRIVPPPQHIVVPPPQPITRPSHTPTTVTPNIRQQAKKRFEELYGRPLPSDFLETWDLPPNGENDESTPGLLSRPIAECDEETLIKIEGTYVNEASILSMTHQGISVLPLQLMGTLSSLTELNLHNNKLSALPATIGSLSNLTKLYVSYNQLTDFPAELTSLPQLMNLDLSHNRLLTMPAQVDQMSALRILELSHNQIRGLPPQMGDLASLRKLYLNHNKLIFVPHELGYLPKVNFIRLNCNPIKNLPVDVYQQGTPVMLEYLRTAGPSVETGGQLKSFLFAKEFSDVEFLVGSEVIPAHKVVLCARSPVLRTFLHSLPDSDDQKLVELQPPEELCDIPVEVFREFIAYLYRDSVEADKLKAIAEQLGRLAIYYGVERLSEMCQRLKYGYIVVSDSSFAKDFSVLMEEPMRYSDVSFIVEGTPIKAHKLFLAASSDYFKGMFTSGLKEAQQSEIIMPHVREDIFRAIREYCYTGDVEEITGDTAVDLLAAACAYSLPRLKGIVEALLGYSLDVDNVACLYPVAQLYEAKVLERACEYFMAQNLLQVKATAAWRDLSPVQRTNVEGLVKKWGLEKSK